MTDAYESLIALVREAGVLSSVESLLDWDQETYMPHNGLSARAEQLSLVARLAHERRTAPAIGDCLARLDGEREDSIRGANIREIRRNYNRATRLPAELVARIAEVSTHARSAWAHARSESNYSKFAPHLATLLDLKREVAERIGYAAEPYDALMDEFEPGAVAAGVAATFDALRRPLSEFARALGAARRRPDPSILHRHFPRISQESLARRLSEAIGFDFKSGRIDVSTHPFCSGTTPGDVRLTTRYYEDFFNPAVFGVLHETGHGLYEQGLEPAHVHTPMGSAASLGIHESQSRLWENMIGRSRPFWERFYPEVQAAFRDSLGSVSLDAFYGAINSVQPSLIRVEADEVTYNLHIIVRFELEREMIAGRLPVNDIPDAWNEKMRDLLGVTPSNDAEGCLQDIHWSGGAFGYFPTYALGNLYAAQFFSTAQQQLPDIWQRVRAGDFSTLLDWLRENIHRHGQRYRADDLVKRVTGQPLSIEPFMAYVRNKFSPIYGI
jgi:carboxypeptidase Taq